MSEHDLEQARAQYREALADTNPATATESETAHLHELGAIASRLSETVYDVEQDRQALLGDADWADKISELQAIRTQTLENLGRIEDAVRFVEASRQRLRAGFPHLWKVK